MGHEFRWVGLLVLLAAAGCAAPLNTGRGDKMPADIRRQLSEEASDSDASLTLSQALREALAAPAEKQNEILATALKRADKARHFSPTLEAPLPTGGARRRQPLRNAPAVLQGKQNRLLELGIGRGPHADLFSVGFA